jgi:putative Mg2+ transporter-C (MgtC) family protein
MSLGQMVLRMLVAVACGGLIGMERERGDRPAGFRTNILVTMGAALFTILSIAAFPESESSRVAAQVVVGIGFLGAGVIILYGGTLVVGITTAATLWASAAVGMAAGAGYFALAAIATGIILVVLVGLYYLEDKTIARISTRRFYLTLQGSWDRDVSPRVVELLGALKARAEVLRVEENRTRS